MSTILIVEDDAHTRRALARLLEQAGYHTIQAEDAHAAMAHARRQKPDLILLDVMIPPMDGLTFLMLLRDALGASSIPTILLTGLSDENTYARAQQMGVKAYLTKADYAPAQLLAVIRQYAPSRPAP